MERPRPGTTARRPAGAHEPDLGAWDPWAPAEVAAILAGIEVPWYVAGGWAIDLFVGEQLREHDDLEIGVPDHAFEQVARALAGHELFVAGGIDGTGLVWPLRGSEATLADHHQTWVRDPATGSWRMDVFREPSIDGRWACRRDPSIALDYHDLIARDGDGIPFARPEVVLLFKAKRVRPKDQADFDAVEPFLDEAARRWLAAGIGRAHPGHPWLRCLG